MLHSGKRIVSTTLACAFLASGCLKSDIPQSSSRQAVIGPGSTTGSTTGGETETSLPPKVEIRHLIEPNLSYDTSYNSGTGYAGGGSYVRKLTLPKNFAGRLYVAGINVNTLSDRLVRVRFKFGVSREAVTLPAIITTAPGITPSNPISVLVVDLRSEPFRNVRLPYDLYDYNDYNNHTFKDASNNDIPPVQDNRDTGLYCRGLNLEDDPTFIGVGQCDGVENNPSQPAEECLYAYAKVLDQGLAKISGTLEVPTLPSFPQIKSAATVNYYMDSMTQALKRPLLDTIPNAGHTITSMIFSQLAVPASSTDSIAYTITNANANTAQIINGTTYYYRGPYRIMDDSNWHFKYADLDGEGRLFKENSYVNAGTRKYYYNSLMFPIATKLSLQAGVPHLSSDAVLGPRVENTLASAGTTKWMDGSNIRAQSRNVDQEHVGSCNVSSTIEIIAKDDNNVDYVVATANDVKLQLVRPTQYRTDTGNEVLYTNFKTCTTNATCGGSECCFNNRCWDQNLVSQCLDPNQQTGHRNIGDSCNTDFECSSLCCNRTTGLCAVHNALLDPPVVCSKPIGEFCIAKEWCAKSPVTKCLIIKTGTDNLGNTTCRQHCYVTQEYGDCKNGVCVAPVQPTIPTFNPNDPNACNNAVDAPNF